MPRTREGLHPLLHLHALHAELIVMCKGKPRKSAAQVEAEMAAMGRVRKKVRDRNGRMVWRWVSKEDVREDNATGPAPAPAEAPTVVPVASKGPREKKTVGGRIGLLDKMSRVLQRREPLPEDREVFDEAVQFGIDSFVLDMDLEKARAVRQAVGADRFDPVLARLSAGRLRYLAGRWTGRKPPSSVKQSQVLDQMVRAVSQPPREPVAPQPPHHGDDLELLMQLKQVHEEPLGLPEVPYQLAMSAACSALYKTMTLNEARHLYAALGDDVLHAFRTVLQENELRYLSHKWNPHRIITKGTSHGDLELDLKSLVAGSAEPLPAPARPSRSQRVQRPPGPMKRSWSTGMHHG